MSDTASSPGTMRSRAIRAYGEEMVLMDDLPGAVSVDRPAVEIIANHVVRGNGARLFDDGALQVAVLDIVPFADAQDALDEVLSGQVRGKVALRIA